VTTPDAETVVGHFCPQTVLHQLESAMFVDATGRATGKATGRWVGRSSDILEALMMASVWPRPRYWSARSGGGRPAQHRLLHGWRRNATVRTPGPL